MREFVRRAEEEVEKMNAELERLEKIPEEVETEWKQKKQLWMEEQKRLLAVEHSVEEAKAAAGRHASAVESEAASLSNKQEKLTARLTKLKAELDKVVAENAANQDQRARREAEREHLVKHRSAMEAEFSQAISKMEKKMQDYRIQGGENWAMAIALENAAAVQNQQAQIQFPPSTPEGGLPGTRDSNSMPPPVITSTPPGFTSLPNPHTTTLASPNRERSSSLFSSDSISLSDIVAADQQQASTSRPPLPSLSAFTGVGYTGNNMPFANGIGGLGGLGMGNNNTSPGFVERLQNSTSSRASPGRLMVFGEPH